MSAKKDGSMGISSDSHNRSALDRNDAATKTELDKPKVIEVGGRQVSWDELLVSLQKKKPGLSAEQSSRKLNLGDVIGSSPAAQEAETHIIRAVEKLKESEDEDEEDETAKLMKNVSAEEANTSPTTKADHSSASMRSPGDNHSTTSNQAGSKAASQVGLKQKARFKTLVNKHIASKNVEQSLLGLSSALNHMHDDVEPKPQSSKRSISADNVGTKAPPSQRAGDLESQIPEETDTEGESEKSDLELNGSTQSGSNKRRHNGFVVGGIEENWEMFNQFMGPRKAKAKAYARKVFMFVMIPSFAIAAVLYYLVENPALCEKEIPEAQLNLEPRVEPVFDVNGTIVGNVTVVPEEPEPELFVCPGLGASASWWFLFLGVRQVVTFTMALITQAFIVDYLALNTRYCLQWFGPVITLLLVQAKGFPFVGTFWALYSMGLNAGTSDFVHHWGYWQDWVGLFNEKNPSGNVVDHEWNYMLLRLVIFVGVSVSLKRLVMSLVLGRQTFARFGEQLAEVMSGMVLVGEVATLAKDIERFSGDYANKTSDLPDASEAMQDLWNDQAKTERAAELPSVNAAEAANAFIKNRNSLVSNTLESPVVPSNGGMSAVDEEFSKSQRQHLSDLLEAWEEPQTAEQKEQKKITIGAVLRFRQALTFMKVRYPFLPAFGLADTREHCIDSAQQVYERLMLRTPNETVLPFDTLALLAKDDDGKIEVEKAKLLIRLFRPDRDGKLSKLDFVKSIDSIYKSIRLLSANITNSSQIDSAVEGIFNVVFYAILGSICLAFLDVDPFQLFFSLSSVLLVFAFAFGNSSSKYFEGMLFILVQAPFGVGDRIHLSRPEQETNIDGSAGWIVEQVSLYTTSVYWVATNERATIANGAISNMRVINASRSPNAQIFVNMKFSIDTPYEKVEIFKAAVEQFLKDRPREWLAFVGFRPTEVAVEKGYINYVTIAQHRSSWQDLGSVLVSKAELVTYELEVAKILEMRYHSPHLPVDLKISNGEMTPQDIQSLSNGGQQDIGQMRDVALNQRTVSTLPQHGRAFLGGDE